MAKYRVLTPIKAADGNVYQVNSTVELSDEEAKNCLSFRAIELVQETSQPVQPVGAATTISVQSTTIQETVSEQEEVVPPESDVR